MKKKGFTLIELLAVIVILGLISVITVPIVMNEINKSRKESYEIGVQNTIESARTYVIENYSENDFPSGGIDVTSGLLKLKNDKYISGIIKKDEKGVIIVENISDGTYCSNGSRNELETIKGDCSKNDDTAPDVKVKLRESKSNSLIYSVTMSDSGSGIKEYKYCYQSCDNEKNWKTEKYTEPYSKKEIKESIILKGLAQNKKYTIKVKVINGNGKETEVTNEKGITKEIEEAKFKVSSSSYSATKEVTIIYPEYQEGYTYSYEYNGEKVTLGAGKKEIKFEVTKTGTVTAKIEYEENGETKEIVSKLNIVNIDNKGPDKVEVTVTPEGWSKTKTVTIKATDEGSGIAFKGYKFDNGEWTNTNKKVYSSNAKIKIKVRDKLGNETTTFNNGQTELVLNSIDTESATCSISVSGVNKEINGNIWYTEKPTITVTYKDYYKDVDGNKKEGGSGVQGTSTMTLTTGTATTKKTVTVNGNKYTTTLQDGMHIVTFSVKDKAGNKEGTCSATVYVDSVKPVIKAKGTEYVAKYKDDIDLLNTYFTISQNYGSLSGTTKCYTVTPNGKQEKTNNNKLTLGINKIKCIMTGKNGKTSTAETTIKHKSTATEYTCPANWTKVDNTCRTGTNKCLKYEQKTDSSCGCKTFNTCDDKTKCKTWEQKTDSSCGCKTYKTCTDTTKCIERKVCNKGTVTACN